MLSSKDRFIASALLVDFIKDFLTLTNIQIGGIRKMLEEVTQEVMGSVIALSKESDDIVAEMNKVRQDPDKSKEISLVELSAKLTEMQQKFAAHQTTLGGVEILRGSGLLSKHLEGLQMMDSQLSPHLQGIVGAISMDDVIAQ
ncbi:MAG: hypothetical protein EOP06_03240, partial [Proteobacteria bacterium]